MVGALNTPSQLLRCASVEQAVVVAWETGDDQTAGASRDLAAYVVADSRWDVGRVRETLKRTLPDYMLPAFFVRLDRISLTLNGKVDRRKLPDPRLADRKSVV